MFIKISAWNIMKIQVHVHVNIQYYNYKCYWVEWVYMPMAFYYISNNISVTWFENYLFTQVYDYLKSYLLFINQS
jgi:hypothetical protein